MTLFVVTKALQTQLVTLADLKAAIVPGDADDTCLARLITRATSHFERICRRKFAREIVRETFNGNSRTDILVSRFPLMNLGVLTLDDATIEATEFKILDEEAGIVFMENGWVENRMIASIITVHQLPQPGDADYSLTYTAGFLLPDDDIITGVEITSNAAGKTFTLSAGKWPLLVANDAIEFIGFTDSDLNTNFTVATRTDTVLTVNETVSADEVGASIRTIVQTLPEELEQASIELINSWFSGRSRDSSLKSEKIGDWAASYGNAIPSYVNEVINHYRVIF